MENYIKQRNEIDKTLEDECNKNLHKKLLKVLLKCYDERFNELINYQLLYCKVKKHQGMIWTFYQFSENKYIIEAYIYSSQWNGKNYLLFGIYDGLINSNVFEIHFPKSLTLILKILSFLPSKIYFSLVGKMTKYQKKN